MKASSLLPVAVATLALLATVPPMSASFARYSDADLLASSAVVVEAEYIGRAAVPLAPPASPAWLGVLRVRSTLKGRVPDGVVLFKVPAPGGLVSSSDITFSAGQAGLWFLRAAPDGSLFADHPQRFLPAGDPRTNEFRKLLRAAR